MHDEPHCPSCQRAFTIDFIETHFSKSFRRNELRKSQIMHLAEREKSLWPMTMEYIRTLNMQEQHDHAIYQFNRLTQLMSVDHVVTQERFQELQNYAQAIQENTVVVAPVTTRNLRTMMCPKDSCAGLIVISNTGTCSLCNTKVCRKCREITSDTHTCDPDTLKTIEALAESTRPCPKCAMAIERISGCAQMFCTNCHTAWDWNSGRVINGPIHNPHYFTYLQQTGTEIQNANVNCNDPLREFSIQNIRTIHSRCQCPSGRMCINCFRTTDMYNYFRIGNWVLDMIRQQAAAYDETTYQDLRVELIRNKITQKQYLTFLSHKETLRRRKVRINEIYLMFVTALRDTLMLFNNQETMIKIKEMIENLRQYTVKQLQKIYADTDKRHFQFFNEQWYYGNFNVH